MTLTRKDTTCYVFDGTKKDYQNILTYLQKVCEGYTWKATIDWQEQESHKSGAKPLLIYTLATSTDRGSPRLELCSAGGLTSEFIHSRANFQAKVHVDVMMYRTPNGGEDWTSWAEEEDIPLKVPITTIKGSSIANLEYFFYQGNNKEIQELLSLIEKEFPTLTWKRCSGPVSLYKPINNVISFHIALGYLSDESDLKNGLCTRVMLPSTFIRGIRNNFKPTVTEGKVPITTIKDPSIGYRPKAIEDLVEGDLVYCSNASQEDADMYAKYSHIYLTRTKKYFLCVRSGAEGAYLNGNEYDLQLVRFVSTLPRAKPKLSRKEICEKFGVTDFEIEED